MKKILLLIGGISAEREISILSGETFYKVCKRLGYDVEKHDFKSLPEFIESLQKIKPDVVVNALHGDYGEDGNIQGVLNLMRLPYTHSGVMTSSVCMYKPAAKCIVRTHGVSVADGKVVTVADIKNGGIVEFPFVIKPLNNGSSVNVHIVFNQDELSKALKCFSDLDRVLLERYIKGRECAVSVLCGRALAVTEIVPQGLFYDYEAKYGTEMPAKHILPAPFPEAIYESALATSELIYSAVSANGAIRIDYIYSEDDGKLYFLEANTQPGMTEMSLLPEQAKHAGIPLDKLVQKMIDEAKCE